MKGTTEQYIQDAERCLRHDIINEEYMIRQDMLNQFRQDISNVLDHEFRIDYSEKRVTKRYVVSELGNYIIELSEDIHGTSTDLVEAFDNQKEEFLQELFHSSNVLYQFGFPLNFFSGGYLPDEIDKLNQISYEGWKSEYMQPALAEDDTHLESFLEESPNEIEKHGYWNTKFTFWTTTYEAREPLFALEKVIDRVRLTLAKVNYIFYKKNIGRGSGDSNKPPVARLSHLQEPFFYLIFDEEDYDRYHPMDYDFRRKAAGIPIRMDEPFGPLRRLPNLSVENLRESEDKEEETVDRSLVQAFLAYQDGMTGSNTRQSFFAFWRGIENLTQADRGEKEEIVDRARAVFNLYQDETQIQSHIAEAFEELFDKRNSLAHEGPHISISGSHQGAAKILLEKLFQLYFDRYDCDYSDHDYQIFLRQLKKQSKCGNDDLEYEERKVEIIEDMRRYQQDIGGE